VAEQAALSFGGLLRQLGVEARLTQEELAEAAGLSPRSVSDRVEKVWSTASAGPGHLARVSHTQASPVPRNPAWLASQAAMASPATSRRG
jgi:transcriptional regulator with XRE-family HTH domain